MLNTYIPPAWDDKVYFFAKELVHDLQDGSWLMKVNPAAGLVCMKENQQGWPTVQDLRRERAQEEWRGRQAIYTGRILFSAGVILLLNGKILLFQRDAEALVDPRLWTTPAGRCDREPQMTAYKEFYEEVIILDGSQNRPVLIIFQGSEVYLDYLKKVYAKTLRRQGFAWPVAQWASWHAAPLELPAPLIQTVRVQVEGGETGHGQTVPEAYEGRFLVFWDQNHNTLELRSVVSLEIPPEQEAGLKLMDGEFNRPVKLFPRARFWELEASRLDRTLVYFRDQMRALAGGES